MPVITPGSKPPLSTPPTGGFAKLKAFAAAKMEVVKRRALPAWQNVKLGAIKIAQNPWTPRVVGGATTFLAYRANYIPHSPVGYIGGTLLAYGIPFAITKWAMGNIVKPSPFRIAVGLGVIGAGVVLAMPATNWAVKNGVVPINNKAVNVVRDAVHTLDLDAYAPDITRNGGMLAPGPARLTSVLPLYNSGSLGALGRMPREFVAKDTYVCVVGASKTVVSVRRPDGNLFFGVNSDQVVPAPESDVCKEKPVRNPPKKAPALLHNKKS